MQTNGMCPQFVISSFLLVTVTFSIAPADKQEMILLNVTTKKKGQFGSSARIHGATTFIHTFTQKTKQTNKNWPNILHFWETIPISNIP